MISKYATGRKGYDYPGQRYRVIFFPDNTYDITLLLGPLYHLYSIADKRHALHEAIRVTKPGGVIFAADGSLCHLQA